MENFIYSVANYLQSRELNPDLSFCKNSFLLGTQTQVAQKTTGTIFHYFQWTVIQTN